MVFQCPNGAYAQRPARDLHAILFGQLLGRQCRAKVGIAVPHERHRVGAQAIADPVVRRSPARLVPDRCSTFLTEDLQQPLNLHFSGVVTFRFRD